MEGSRQQQQLDSVWLSESIFYFLCQPIGKIQASNKAAFNLEKWQGDTSTKCQIKPKPSVAPLKETIQCVSPGFQRIHKNLLSHLVLPAGIDPMDSEIKKAQPPVETCNTVKVGKIPKTSSSLVSSIDGVPYFVWKSMTPERNITLCVG